MADQTHRWNEAHHDSLDHKEVDSDKVAEEDLMAEFGPLFERGEGQ